MRSPNKLATMGWRGGSRLGDAWENSKSLIEFAQAIGMNDPRAACKVLGAVAFGAAAAASIPLMPPGVAAGAVVAVSFIVGYAAGKLYEEAFDRAGELGSEFGRIIGNSITPVTLFPMSCGQKNCRSPYDPDDMGDRFDDASHTTSPIVLDLNGDGVKTVKLSHSMYSGVHFDNDARGLAENTGWADASDGLLVRDLNGDGKITSGRELFGNHTLLKSGAEAVNGFGALKEQDDNADGVVDANDVVFTSLRVWKDIDSDGVTDEGELLSMAEAGVLKLQVAYTTGTVTDDQGNQHLQLGSYTKTDGSTQKMADVWFAVDSARTVDRGVFLGAIRFGTSGFRAHGGQGSCFSQHGNLRLAGSGGHGQLALPAPNDGA